MFNASGKQVYPKTDFSPYLVEVTATDLNIRKGPGTNYGKTGKFTGKGVFTITEERAGTGSNKGWGKLKSGAGWISLDYVKDYKILPGGKMLSGRIFTLFPIIENKRYRKKTCYSWGLE